MVVTPQGKGRKTPSPSTPEQRAPPRPDLSTDTEPGCHLVSRRILRTHQAWALPRTTGVLQFPTLSSGLPSLLPSRQSHSPPVGCSKMSAGLCGFRPRAGVGGAGSWPGRLLLAPAVLSPDWRGQLMWLESWLKSIAEMPLALLVVSSCIGLSPYAQRPALCTLCMPISVCAL